jgi:hypothetical protein
MTEPLATARPRRGRVLLVAGLGVTGLAGTLGLVGFAVTTIAVASIARRRMDQLDVRPRQLAKQTWTQARAATAAGLDAWRAAPVTRRPSVEASVTSRAPTSLARERSTA